MELTTNKYRSSLTKKGSFLLSTLARQDKNIFTTDEARDILKKDPKKIMSDLIENKWVLPLKKGLYAIVPLDIGPKGADDFLIHDFIIASYLTKPYFISFWSALNYYGFSDQIPTTVFIATNKPLKPLKILNSKFLFVRLSGNKFLGITKIRIEDRDILIADKNKTIADCLDHPEHSGGIEEVARSIYFSHKELNISRVKYYALQMKNMTILKRLGYILEKTNLMDEYSGHFQDFKPSKGYSKLDTIGQPKGKYNEKWKLLINTEIDPDRWMY